MKASTSSPLSSSLKGGSAGGCGGGGLGGGGDGAGSIRRVWPAMIVGVHNAKEALSPLVMGGRAIGCLDSVSCRSEEYEISDVVVTITVTRVVFWRSTAVQLERSSPLLSCICLCDDFIIAWTPHDTSSSDR